MPILCEFDSRVVHPPDEPEIDTQEAIDFPHPFVARPRLPHGFRELDIDKGAPVRVKATHQYFTKEWIDSHIVAWDDTTLYSGIDDIFVLAPADLDFLTGEHMRDLVGDPNDPPTARVEFDRPFPTPPKVAVFFNYIDLDNGHNWRLKTSATDIDENGFTLHIETSGDTVLYAAQTCWIAYPEDRPHIFSATVDTLDIRPANQPRLQQSKNISFGETHFWKEPTVFIGLNHIDIDCQRNLRIRSYADAITRAGLILHIDAWGDTILYAAGVSIIAFNE